MNRRPVHPRRVLLGRLAFLAIVAQVLLAANHSTTAADPPGQFGSFLLGCDIVFTGTLGSATLHNRYTRFACNYPDTQHTALFDYPFSLDSVLSGTLEDSVFTLTAIVDLHLPPRPDSLPWRVLAWAHRECTDNWRIHGAFCGITPDGRLVPAYGQPPIHIEGQPDDATPTLAAAIDHLQGPLGALPKQALNGSTSIGLGRVTAIGASPDGSHSYTLDDLGVLLGQPTQLPSVLRAPAFPRCSPRIQVGDSLLVPVGALDTGNSLRACPRILRIKHRYVPSLAVYLDFLNYAIQIDQGVADVRTFVSAD